MTLLAVCLEAVPSSAPRTDETVVTLNPQSLASDPYRDWSEVYHDEIEAPFHTTLNGDGTGLNALTLKAPDPDQVHYSSTKRAVRA